MFGENLKQMELLFQPNPRCVQSYRWWNRQILVIYSFQPQNSSNFGSHLTSKLSHFTPKTQRDILKYIFSTLTKGNTGKKMRQYKRRFTLHENGTNTPADFRSAKINKVAKSNWIIVYIYRAIFFSNA